MLLGLVAHSIPEVQRWICPLPSLRWYPTPASLPPSCHSVLFPPQVLGEWGRVQACVWAQGVYCDLRPGGGTVHPQGGFRVMRV